MCSMCVGLNVVPPLNNILQALDPHEYSRLIDDTIALKLLYKFLCENSPEFDKVRFKGSQRRC